jgi:hypothetical protein
MTENTQLEKNLYFEEIQQFRQSWIWFLIMPISLFGIIVFIYIMFMQFILGKPVGTNPMPNSMLIWFGPLMLVIMISIPILMYIMKLEVRIDSEAIHIRYFPFLKRNISLDEIVTCKVRKYKPLLEYGGWGIRWGPGGKAYNVSGSWGVQLKFTNGKKLLIGSQKANEFEAAVNSAKNL